MNGLKLEENESMQNPNNKYISVVQEDPESGDLLIELPLELLEEMGWSVGDILEWSDVGNGSWSIRKKDVSSLE